MQLGVGAGTRHDLVDQHVLVDRMGVDDVAGSVLQCRYAGGCVLTQVRAVRCADELRSRCPAGGDRCDDLVAERMPGGSVPAAKCPPGQVMVGGLSASHGSVAAAVAMACSKARLASANDSPGITP